MCDVLGTQGRWTEEEDTKLISLIQQWGHKWRKVSAELNRSYPSCRYRWRWIHQGMRRGNQKSKGTKDYEGSKPSLLCCRGLPCCFQCYHFNIAPANAACVRLLMHMFTLCSRFADVQGNGFIQRLKSSVRLCMSICCL